MSNRLGDGLRCLLAGMAAGAIVVLFSAFVVGAYGFIIMLWGFFRG